MPVRGEAGRGEDRRGRSLLAVPTKVPDMTVKPNLVLHPLKHIE